MCVGQVVGVLLGRSVQCLFVIQHTLTIAGFPSSRKLRFLERAMKTVGRIQKPRLLNRKASVSLLMHNIVFKLFAHVRCGNQWRIGWEGSLINFDCILQFKLCLGHNESPLAR